MNPLQGNPQHVELLKQINILATGYNVHNKLIEGDEDFVPQGHASRLHNIRRVYEWARNHRYPLNYLLLLFDPKSNVLDNKEPEQKVIDPPPPEPAIQEAESVAQEAYGEANPPNDPGPNLNL